MKIKYCFVIILLVSFVTFVACIPDDTKFSDDANSEYVPDDKEDPKPEDPKPEDPEPGYQLTEEDKKINLQLFEIINLDYPGLATVKDEYSQKHYAKAAAALLEYFRNRTNVVNPERSAGQI